MPRPCGQNGYIARPEIEILAPLSAEPDINGAFRDGERFVSR
jgi:hypothetical protein